MMLLCYLTLFQSNFPFLYPQKTSENKNFSAGIEIEHGVKTGYINENFDHIWQFQRSCLALLCVVKWMTIFFWLYSHLVSPGFCLFQFLLQVFDFICISLKKKGYKYFK